MHPEVTGRAALWLLATGLVAASVIACGEVGPTCGAGTKAVDGRCVASGPLVCGPGTAAAGGSCVLADVGASDAGGGDLGLDDVSVATSDAAPDGHGVTDPVADASADALKDVWADAVGGADANAPEDASGGDSGAASGCIPPCAPEQVCADGMCVDPVLPAGWQCAAASYADGQTCHCACGAPDPDCANTALPVKHCPSGKCSAAGLCENCKPSCEGKSCGPDGCGALCGMCNNPKQPVCQGGQCVTACVPSCAGAVCGSDGCGGSCGACAGAKACALGQCVDVAPDASCTGGCGAKAPSGCGCDATCAALGTCCADFAAVCGCVPDCLGKGCGPDGCGGVCGTCKGGDVCDGGTCAADPCDPDPCSSNGTCAPKTGACACKEGFGGPNCKVCAEGYVGYPQCIQDLCAGKSVQCSGHGACAASTGACGCDPGFAGAACETCAPGAGTWPNCADPCASQPNCDDGNGCTVDSCDKGKGCVHATTVLVCEDGDPCTLGDTCQSGACVAGGKVCDLGVNSADDASDGSCNAAHCSLREAIIAANASGKAASIGFGAVGPIVLTEALPASFVPLQVIAAGGTVTIAAGGKGRIFHAKTDLTLANLVLQDGAGGTTGGGAVWAQAGKLTMSKVKVVGATSAGSGGGVRASGEATLDQCAFGSNKLTAANATGAAVHLEGQSAIHRSVFAENAAVGAGGAVSCGPACSLSMDRSGFVANAASHGGALHVQGKALVVNSTFVGNTAALNGGAISAPGSLEAVHVTVAGNSAPNIAGIGASGSLALRNSIIGDSLGGGADCAATQLIATVSNLVSDGSCNALYKGPILLAPLSAGCDLLPQRPPLSGSPARDAGDAAACNAPPTSAVDQCGVARPVGKGCDLGAVEAAGP